MKSLITFIKKHTPPQIFSIYHFLFAFLGALWYGFPSRHITVIGVTGTKGKSSTTELIGNILEEAGYATAILGTIRFKIGDTSTRNLKKMTMPGRFFVQKFIHDAVKAGCSHIVIEMTSEGAKQFRQRFIAMDALVFTNLSPEHIESHGSFEKYRDAKLSIARTLARSSKPKRYTVVNYDDKNASYFSSIKGLTPVGFTLADAQSLSVSALHSSFLYHNIPITSSLGGVFNVYNILAALSVTSLFGVSKEAMQKGIAQTAVIAGRNEHVDGGQEFPVVVDYAHTPDSLEALYRTYSEYKTVCILGNTGGGRDKWKRPVMGHLAETYCDTIILANEDPYDEDPMQILEEIKGGMNNKTPTIILDRREAIAHAIEVACAKDKSAVLISGKGTDPFIMGPNGTKIPWDDRDVAREELKKRFGKNHNASHSIKNTKERNPK